MIARASLKRPVQGRRILPPLYCHLHLLLLLLLLPACLAAQKPTTGTVHLSDLFDTRPGEQAFIPGPARQDTGGALLFLPDTAAWRAPRPAQATPPPQIDLPEGLDLPRLEPAVVGRSLLDVDVGRPAFQSRGRDLAGEFPVGMSLLTIETVYKRLRAQYILHPILEPGAPALDELVFYHAPQTIEQFALPAGRYRLVRRVWLGGDTSKVLTESYDPQLLSSRGRYRFTPNETDEAEIIEQHFSR